MKNPFAGAIFRLASTLGCFIGLGACQTTMTAYESSGYRPLARYEERSRSQYSKSAIRALIVREAQSQGVDPALALAIARAESNFNPNALSPAGARGVMQIMPATARSEFGVSADRLWDPRTNINIGIRFFKRLLNAYGGRVDIALSHYNGGSRVRTARGLRVIPSTRGYVDKVLRYRTAYAGGRMQQSRGRMRTASRAPSSAARQRSQTSSSQERIARAAKAPSAGRRPAREDRCERVGWRERVNGRLAILAGLLCSDSRGEFVIDRRVVTYVN